MNALRMSFGTLTVLPVRMPTSVDRGVSGWAMTLSPLVGFVLGLPVVVLLVVVAPWAEPFGGDWHPGVSASVAAVLGVGAVALLTRGIHLDGLADTVDGLGSGRPATEALAVMRKGDVGPFGVVGLVLVVLVEVAALAHHLSAGTALLAVPLALVVSRLALPLMCGGRVPAARAEGLGRAVAGSVTAGQQLLAVVLALGLVAGWALVLWAAGLPGDVLVRMLLAAPFGLLPAGLVCWWCVRRLGGITGDVLGACVEAGFAATLVLLTLAR